MEKGGPRNTIRERRSTTLGSRYQPNGGPAWQRRNFVGADNQRETLEGRTVSRHNENK